MDALFVFHKSGNQFSKIARASMAADTLANEKLVQDSSRCIYENDVIMVSHDFMSYPNETK